jgi:hypothetical protein
MRVASRLDQQGGAGHHESDQEASNSPPPHSLRDRLNISMIRFLSKHEMSHMAVPYTVDLILFNVAVYPLGERDSERLKDRTVVVYLALHDPGMGVGQVGVEHFPVRVFYHHEHVVEGRSYPMMTVTSVPSAVVVSKKC